MAIRRKFPEANIYIEDFEEPVYIRVAVNHLVEYEYVIVMQQALTDLSSPWLGICESWGVLH